jgi:hypothetical protein
LPRDGIVYTWVIENEVNGKMQVTDFFSMHRLGQKCTSEGCKHEYVYNGYGYFYGLTMNNWREMIRLLCILAKEEASVDALSIQTFMDNNVDELMSMNFLYGDGKLHYYLVNWSIG